MSANAYSKASGLTRQAIDKRIKVCNSKQIKTVEALTTGGLKVCNFIPASALAASRMSAKASVCFDWALLGWQKNQAREKIASKGLKDALGLTPRLGEKINTVDLKVAVGIRTPAPSQLNFKMLPNVLS